MKIKSFLIIITALFLSACNGMSTNAPSPDGLSAPTLAPSPSTSTALPPTPTRTGAATTSPTTTPIPFPTETMVPTPKIQTGQIQVPCHNASTDAADINWAILNSAVGDEIVISGTCQINQVIRLLGDRSYRGTSRTGTILKQADGANLMAILATDTYLDEREWTGTPVSIRGMTLDGNSQMNQLALTNGIILRSWLSVVEDMYITDMSNDGIHLAFHSANNPEMVTSQVNGCISGNLINESGRYGVFGELGVTDWNLVDNWIAFSGADGLHLEDVAGWVIERNHIYGVPHNAIHAEHLFGTSISDNYIEGFGETEEIGEWYGIYATIQGGAASTISDNRIFNIGPNREGPNNPNSIYRYIATTVNYETGIITLTGNTLRGMKTGDEYGFYLTATGHKLTVVSLGNAVIDIRTPRFVEEGVLLSEGY